MEASLSKTARVLHLVQPESFSGGSFQPGINVTFTSRITSAGAAVSVDTPEPVLLQFPWSLWTEFGRPDEVTITVRPDDTLN